MMANHFIDKDAGNDSWNGLYATHEDNTDNGPKQHLYALFSDPYPLTLPLEEDAVVHLAGSLETPLDYSESENGEISFKNIQSVIGNNYRLTVKSGLFNDGTYPQARDPFPTSNNPPIFDILTASWPVIVPKITIEGCRNISLKGLYISDDKTEDILVLMTGSTGVQVHYCCATGGVMGFTAADFSMAELYNVLSMNNMVGAAASMRSTLSLCGENFIRDCSRAGVRAAMNSTIRQIAWFDRPSKCVTEIRTTKTAGNYAAVQATEQSLYCILDKYISAGDIPISFLKIINEDSFKAKDYFGVLLQGISGFIGKEKTFFSDKDLNQGNATIPSDNQFSGDEGCSVND